MPSTHQPDHPPVAHVPDPDPTSSRTSAADKLWTALESRPGSTSAELATAAAVGRSTATKLLAQWSAEGLVTRTTTPTNGQPGRSPERWTITNPAAPHHTPTDTDIAEERPAHRPDVNLATADAHAPNLDHDPPGESSAAAATEANDAADDVGQATDSAPPNDAQDDHSTEPGAAPPPDGAPAEGASRRTRAAASTGRARRLPSGGLRGLVEDYLREHPDKAFGPSQIGKDLSRSGGAVANALAKLVDAGCAVVAQDKPRRYRLAPAEANPAANTPAQAAT